MVADTETLSHSVMAQLEALVGDIQQATYSMMPATLARAPAAQSVATQSKPAQQQFHTKVRSDTGSCFLLESQSPGYAALRLT